MRHDAPVLREALACVGLGLRDVPHAGLWWRSALCSVAAVGMWLWLYCHFGGFFLQVSGVITLASEAGLLGLGVLDFGPGMAAGPASLSNMGSLNGMGGLVQSLMSIAQVALVALALASVVYAENSINATFIVGVGSLLTQGAGPRPRSARWAAAACQPTAQYRL
ncbi:MAG: hypothetical protein ABIQ08_14050 [Duganella sp.]